MRCVRAREHRSTRHTTSLHVANWAQANCLSFCQVSPNVVGCGSSRVTISTTIANQAPTSPTAARARSGTALVQWQISSSKTMRTLEVGPSKSTPSPWD